MMLLAITVVGLGVGFAWAHKRKDIKAVYYERLYLSLVFAVVGVNGILLGFIPHVFFSDYVAGTIGWAKGSPFQLEVGYHNGCWGVIGLLSAWFKSGFALASGIGFSLFLLLAGWGHLRETVLHGNFAPGNFGFIAGDIIPGILLLILARLYTKHSLKGPAGS
jgi:hypothetical protein